MPARGIQAAATGGRLDGRPGLNIWVEHLRVTVAIGDRHPWPALDQPAAIGGGMLDGLPYRCGYWLLITLAFLTGCVTVEGNTCGESTVGERPAKHSKLAADELNQTLLVGLYRYRYCCWPTLPGWPFSFIAHVGRSGYTVENRPMRDNTTISRLKIYQKKSRLG